MWATVIELTNNNKLVLLRHSLSVSVSLSVGPDCVCMCYYEDYVICLYLVGVWVSAEPVSALPEGFVMFCSNKRHIRERPRLQQGKKSSPINGVFFFLLSRKNNKFVWVWEATEESFTWCIGLKILLMGSSANNLEEVYTDFLQTRNFVSRERWCDVIRKMCMMDGWRKGTRTQEKECTEKSRKIASGIQNTQNIVISNNNRWYNTSKSLLK